MTYAVREFGYDHGFLSAWFLVLVYIAIIWANATAFPLIVRSLLGSLLQFGFHYHILNYDVYFGEVLLAFAGIAVFGLVCVAGKRIAMWLQIIFAVVLFLGVGICAAVVIKSGNLPLRPSYAPGKGAPAGQILNIVALTPWAFAGFESVSNSTEGFRFSTKKTIWIMAAALVTSSLSYILLSTMAATALPDGFASWAEYIGALDTLNGLETLPTFYAANAAMGRTGLIILAVAVAAGAITGLIGNYIAASRLLYKMAEDGILPKWFGRLNGDHGPRNALLFLMGISVIVPFFGRTAVGWIVDVTTIGAIIAYAYTSSSALAAARREGRRLVCVTGAVGIAASILFFFYFMSWNANAMSTESYLILAGWSILGFIYSRYMFTWDKERRFGKSFVVWVGALFLIFFTTLMWVKQATRDVTELVVDNLGTYNAQELERHGASLDVMEQAESASYLQQQMALVNNTLERDSMIQLAIVLIALSMMFGIYFTMRKRETEQAEQRLIAEESSKAKTTFLSNMSHDIRTPMNAIIGYTTLAEREENDLAQVRDYLAKIKTSSHHLLALINDVLEMSRIESGRMDLGPVAIDLCDTLAEAWDMFSTQMAEKEIDFTVDTSEVRRSRVYCDKNRLNRVLLNLLSNAYKFTPRGGSVAVVLRQTDEGDGDAGYELHVRDSGIGMSPEFAERVFEAFERERTSTVSGIQGTGLGMAITKNIVDLMGGTIEVVTAPGEGSEFIIRLRLRLQSGQEAEETPAEKAPARTLDFSRMRVLLAEDNEINREIATLLLEERASRWRTRRTARTPWSGLPPPTPASSTPC